MYICKHAENKGKDVPDKDVAFYTYNLTNKKAGKFFQATQRRPLAIIKWISTPTKIVLVIILYWLASTNASKPIKKSNSYGGLSRLLPGSFRRNGSKVANHKNNTNNHNNNHNSTNGTDNINKTNGNHRKEISNHNYESSSEQFVWFPPWNNYFYTEMGQPGFVKSVEKIRNHDLDRDGEMRKMMETQRAIAINAASKTTTSTTSTTNQPTTQQSKNTYHIPPCDAIGLAIDRLMIEDKNLGIGNSSLRFAKDIATGTKFVIKIYVDTSTYESLYNNFIAELSALSKLQHPYLVRAVCATQVEYIPEKYLSTNMDFDTTAESDTTTENLQHYKISKYPAILMERIDGIRADQYVYELGKKILLNRKLHDQFAQEVVLIMAQIYEFVIYVHKHGLVHNDLKPQDILVEKTGRIRIVDLDRVTAVCLTPHYAGTQITIAPEKVYHVTGNLHEASDMWSLGATFAILMANYIAGVCPTGTSMDNLAELYLEYSPFEYDFVINKYKLVPLPGFLTKEASELLYLLFAPNPDDRRFVLPEQTKIIKQMKFFEHVDWNAIENPTENPPFFDIAQIISATSSRPANNWYRKPRSGSEELMADSNSEDGHKYKSSRKNKEKRESDRPNKKHKILKRSKESKR